MSEPALRLDPAATATPAPAASPVLDTAVAQADVDLASTLRAIAARHGKTYQQAMLEIAKASFGPGRLTFEEYIALRLFDDAQLAGADKSAFVGLEASRSLWMAANTNSEWWGLMRNKLAVTTLLGGYGFPVIPTLALYSDTLCLRGAPVLRDPAALATFLRTSDAYPLFAKPMDSQRSLGSAGLDAYQAHDDGLQMSDGQVVPVDQFAADVAKTYSAGYLLQRRVAPHAAVRAIAGERLATVRVLTILDSNGPEVLRALWKIPAGSNVADNYWRSGNLLATIDLGTGRVVRAVRGSGLALEEVTHHPDTGAALIGIEVPNWREVVALAQDAAATLNEVPLIGWDIAAVEAGALIVEPNFTPDLFMPQLADRRGMLDARFKAFLATCKARGERVKARRRFNVLTSARDGLRRLGRSIAGV